MRFEMHNIKDEQVYKDTLCLVLLKVLDDIDSRLDVHIGNSLNQGFFVYWGDTDAPLSNAEFGRIKDGMRAIIDADIEIETVSMSNAAVAELWRACRWDEKADLLENRDPDEEIRICKLGDYINCFYGEVLPSTGLLESYELRRYKNGLLLRHPYADSKGKIPEYRDDDKLYKAFAESKRMRKALGIDYLADLNKRTDAGEIASVIEDAEEEMRCEIAEIAGTIVEQGKRIVLIAGPSSSGKTTFAKRLCKAIAEISSEPIYLGTDDYFVERKDTPLGPDGEPDYEGLGALDKELFNEQMAGLLEGREIDMPTYDFVKGEKIFGDRKLKAKPGQTIVIEGIHSLNDELTPDIDISDKFKIYISPLTRIGIDRHNRLSTAGARLLRRMVRDNQFRGYTAAQTIHTWPKVRLGESRNIFPYSSSADVVFNSSLVYETALLVGFARPLLEEIGPEEPEYEEAQRLLEVFKYFNAIEEASLVPDDSLLKEFIG